MCVRAGCKGKEKKNHSKVIRGEFALRKLINGMMGNFLRCV